MCYSLNGIGSLSWISSGSELQEHQTSHWSELNMGHSSKDVIDIRWQFSNNTVPVPLVIASLRQGRPTLSHTVGISGECNYHLWWTWRQSGKWNLGALEWRQQRVDIWHPHNTELTGKLLQLQAVEDSCFCFFAYHTFLLQCTKNFFYMLFTILIKPDAMICRFCDPFHSGHMHIICCIL